MRRLTVDVDDPVLQNLAPLQFRAANNPLLPRLKSFDCHYPTDDALPLIPFLLSPQTTEINITFSGRSTVVNVASTIGMIPRHCPNIERITINVQDGDIGMTKVAIDAVSEMSLGCDRNSLRVFEVNSPLTEEAREVVYRLPNLSGLRTVIKGRTLLPQVILPNLKDLYVEYDDHLDWLQGFREATFGKLQRASFHPRCPPISDFLRVFAKVALTTSAPKTLSEFRFNAVFHWDPDNYWDPDYYSLLPFKQLKILDMHSKCWGCCSSTVDDHVIKALAQAMPKLEILRLGGTPCKTPTGATVHGLIVLASCCLNLSNLKIHFQAHTLAGAAIPFRPTDGPVIPQEDRALMDLDVGNTPIPVREAKKIAQVLLQIFPRVRVLYDNEEWKRVKEHMKDFRRAGALVCRLVRPY